MAKLKRFEGQVSQKTPDGSHIPIEVTSALNTDAEMAKLKHFGAQVSHKDPNGPYVHFDESHSYLNIDAEKALQKKFDDLGGERFFGTVVRKGSVTWYYQGGCLCYIKERKIVFEIHGDIYKKWQILGGVRWAMPTTDELPCVDTIGRFNHFIGSSGMIKSIFWSPQTGANAIWGDIRKKWSELGFERSYLGYPISDEIDFPENGRANGFQNGDIYFWGDTGAIDMKNVRIFYSGLYCIQESDWDQSSNSDEPYVIIGVSSAKWVGSYTTPTYSDVDSHESRPGWMEIYHGKPYGITIGTVVMEHDEGDQNKYRDEIQKILMVNHEIGTAALGLIPLVGPIIAGIVGPALGKLMPKIGESITKIFNWQDDKVGSDTKIMSAREMILLARGGLSNEHNITYNFLTIGATSVNGKTPAGAYRVYFQILPE